MESGKCSLEGVGIMFDLSFYKGKKVLITGHSGFKGVWLTEMLLKAGAEVVGYSLCKENEKLFEMTQIKKNIEHIQGDIRDLARLSDAFKSTKPEIVFHLAAQPIVKESYKNPVETYSTNVMGTVNVLEAVRFCDSVKSVLNVTTDKVYENKEWDWGYREYEPLNGFDPYSNSKSCSELVTSSYINSFLSEQGVAVSTARAGNVIGGGDFAKDRIIPDCVQAAINHEKIFVRNPHSIRPYQHVLEPVYAYLMIAGMQYQDSRYASNYNVGPNENDCVETCDLVDLFVKAWGDDAKWEAKTVDGPHEASILRLDCSKIKNALGWRPIWNIDMAVKKVVEWNKKVLSDNNANKAISEQIDEYISEL